MKKLMTLTLLAALPWMGHAQSLDEDLNAEIDQVAVDSAAQPGSAAGELGGEVDRLSVKLTPQRAAKRQAPRVVVVQKQPTTVIEASPLTESRADQIRRQRQDTEIQTEQKIVEKLEQSRMEDEKRRAGVLFGDKFDNLNGQAQQAPAVQQAPVTPPPVPVQVVSEPKQALDRDMIREELHAAMSDLKPVEEKQAHRPYMSIMAGMADYPQARNVQGQYAFGFNLGTRIEDRFLVEAGFMYSNFKLNKQTGYYNPYTGQFTAEVTEVDQYSVSGVAKYSLFTGILRPFFGLAMAYNYRNYTDTQFLLGSNTANTQSLDWGPTLGAEFEMSKDYSLGVDFKYMWNLSSRSNSQYDSYRNQNYYPNYLPVANETPLEKISHYILSIYGRMSF